MIKLIISDLDETLINSNKEISQKDIETIKELKKQDVLFLPATGRPFFTVDPTLDDLDLYDELDLTISYNGGMIHRNHDAKILSLTELDFDLVSFLYEFGTQFDVTVRVYADTTTYIYNLREEERIWLGDRYKYEVKEEKQLTFLKDEPILKILYQNTDIPYLESIEALVPDHIKEHLEISYSSNRYLEFNPKGVSKGHAVHFISEYLDIPIENILTIGDNNNDLSMLQTTPLSAAPSNAREEVKEAVTYVSDKSHDESAVTDILNHFIK